MVYLIQINGKYCTYRDEYVENYLSSGNDVGFLDGDAHTEEYDHDSGGIVARRSECVFFVYCVL